MPDIFDEVEEDLRADRLRRMLLRYGGLLAAAALAVVIGVAGWQGWVWYQGRNSLKTAEAYLVATKAADGAAGGAAGGPTGPARDEAQQLLANVAASGGPGYRTLARLREAALLADAGNLAGADAAWDEVAADGGADPLLRDFASLQWAWHNLDAGDPATVAARLQKLAAPNAPWHGLASEAQALLALRQGHVDAARDTLRLLVQDTGAPQGVRQRAGGLLEQIGATAGDAPASGH